MKVAREAGGVGGLAALEGRGWVLGLCEPGVLPAPVPVRPFSPLCAWILVPFAAAVSKSAWLV